MYCNFCGKQMQDDALHCAYCGRRVGLRISQRKLERPREGRKVGGVCAALANYLELDVTLIRVVWLVMFFCAGVGGLAYVVGWIVIPEAPEYVAIERGQTAQPVAKI